MYYTYILYSQYKDKYYIGESEDPQKRLISHNNGISRYTSITNDWKIVHVESFKTRSEAIKREKSIKKKKSRKYIEWIISQ